MFLVALNLLVINTVIGQSIIRGKITDFNGEVPIGVTVYLKTNNTVGTLSDINGEYELKVNLSGPQVFVISYVGYKTIQDTLFLKKGEVLIKNYVLESSAIALSQVTITGKTKHSTDIHMENIKKMSSNTLDYISADIIKRTVDNNVASAITRVTGVSSTSSGFITVRGTGDRYIKTAINGLRIPTLDPLTNNIKLDIFPATLVDNIVISKTASPDLPGDWAGAYISIETKQFPEKLTLNMETSFGYNNQTTNHELLSSERSSTDWLGFDNMFRDRDHSNYVQFNNNPTTYEEFVALGLGDYFNNLGINRSTPWNDTYFKLGLVELGLLGKAQFDDPKAFEDAKKTYNSLYYKEHAFDLLNAEAVKSEKSLPNTWKSTTRKVPLNFSQSFSVGNQTKLFGKSLGYLLGFRYSSSTQYDPQSFGNRFSIESRITNGHPTAYDSLAQEVGKENRSWSAILGAAYKLNKNNTISFLFMPNVTGVNNTRSLKNISTYGADSGTYIHRIYQIYESREQMIYQLKTEHFIPGPKLKIEFNSSFTNGKSTLPDVRVSMFIPEDAPIQNDPAFIIGTNFTTGRYYRYLNENIFDSQLSAEMPLVQKSDLVRKIRFGIAYQNAERQQDNYYYQLMAGDGSEYIQQLNPNADAYGLDRFDIVTIPGNQGDSLRSVQQYYSRPLYPNNRVFGKSNIKAAFVMADFAFNSMVRFSGGLRIEKAYMHTDCNLFDELNLASDDNRRKFVAPSPILDIMIRPGELNKMSYLPSLGMILKLRKDENSPINMRMNYSKTLARPSLRELSDNAYYDYEINQVVYGNSQLKMVDINNYDFRLESYFKSGDNISLSLFYKDFKNHIEVADYGLYLIWINNPNKAWVQGIELEGKKNITSWLEFRANITLTDSRSAFNTSYTKPDGYTVMGRDIDRTMLDQAPYVINAMLTWNATKAGLTTSVSYNTQGPRVIRTGSYQDIPDIYELPRNLVDVKILKNLNKHFSISLKIMDILNTPIVRAYKINNNFDLIYDQYSYGTNYVGSISYKF